MCLESRNCDRDCVLNHIFLCFLFRRTRPRTREIIRAQIKGLQRRQIVNWDVIFSFCFSTLVWSMMFKSMLVLDIFMIIQKSPHDLTPFPSLGRLIQYLIVLKEMFMHSWYRYIVRMVTYYDMFGQENIRTVYVFGIY